MILSFWYKESALSLNNQGNVRRVCELVAATLRPFYTREFYLWFLYILLLIYFLEGLMKGTQPRKKSDNFFSLKKNFMKGVNQRGRWKLEPRF
jgi:surface polysaccharide O-acyltransferase-like enzyme